MHCVHISHSFDHSICCQSGDNAHTAALGFQCLLSASSTSQWLIFLCFTLSRPPSLPHSLIPLCVAYFSSIHFSSVGFIDMKFDMCHPSTLQQKLINPFINQDVNLLSTAPSLLSLPFFLSYFPSFISPICYRLLGF